MGHKSKFTFPVPGWRTKPATEPSGAAVPLTKVQKILGTGGSHKGASTAPKGPPARQQPWDSRSGISISISESSNSATDTGLEIVEEETNRAAGTNYRTNGWDAESDVIPRQLQPGVGLRPQRSAATIGDDYRTDASSLQRRQSNASTIYSHYDRSKVPLSISQQTSNSAMAKGLPGKASSLLDMDGSLAGAAGKKKKPSRLDLSMLNPRSRKGQNAQTAHVLDNDYVTRSPSFMSQVLSPSITTRKLRKSPSTISTGTYDSPRGVQDSASLSQLYDHYEQTSLRTEPSTDVGDNMGRPRFDSVAEESEPTPALTTSSTISLVTPLSNPAIREPSRYVRHQRKDSIGSRNTATTTVSSPSLAPSSHLSPGRDYASSISSRNTRGSKTSKTSRTLDSDLLSTSVLSLSDSESDDGTMSDSAPKSSISSHTNISREDVSILSDNRKGIQTRTPLMPERSSGRQKHENFAPLNDYLAVPSSSGKGHNARQASNSTLRSYSSSTSTATATANSITSATCVDRFSFSTSDTTVSHGSRGSQKKQAASKPVAREAKAVALKPLASTTEALDSLRMLTAQATVNHRRALNSEQLTPPLSPASIGPYAVSPGPKDSIREETADAEDARLMAVTKQEEMLLAALRHKRALMRENILAELEGGDKSSTTSRRISTNTGGRESHLSARTSKTISPRISSIAPQLPPFSSRDSSLVSSFRRSTERKESVRRTDNNVRFADEAQDVGRGDPAEERSSSAMSNATLKDNSNGRHEHVLLFLDRSLHEVDYIDAAEPSPDLSEFLDFDQDSDGEILPERRRSRRTSRFNSTYGTPNVPNQRDERPRADSNPLGTQGSSSYRQLGVMPESTTESSDEDDIDFDGFSDMMSLPQFGIYANEDTGEHGVARLDNPVREYTARHHSKGHVKGKNSAVRLSAVGNVGSFLPPEVGLWGDDG